MHRFWPAALFPELRLADIALHPFVKRVASDRLARTRAYQWTNSVIFVVCILALNYYVHTFIGSRVTLALMLPVIAVLAVMWYLIQLAILRTIQHRVLRRVLREQGIPVCIECGYSLRDAPLPRCPECGWVVD